MSIADLGVKPIDFCSYFILVSPALRDAAARPLRRARHRGRPCQGVQAPRWCDECEQTIADLLLAGYNRLSGTMSGTPPRTKTGEPIREMHTVVQWLATPRAAEDLHQAATQIRRRPTPHELPYIRAARAQLVYYELRSIEAKVARADAQARGASAQPVRDLKTAGWAAPLRTDDHEFELLLNAVLRLRKGARDPLDIPGDLIDRALGVDRSHAQRMLRNKLEQLRQLHPGFYCANVVTYLSTTEELSASAQTTVSAPEELIIDRENAHLARRTLTALIADQGARPPKDHYRALLKDISATVLPSGPQLLAWVTRQFGIDMKAAETFVRTLIRLACSAGLDWVAKECT